MAMLDALIDDAIANGERRHRRRGSVRAARYVRFSGRAHARDRRRTRRCGRHASDSSRLMDEQRERARRDAAAKRDVVTLADLPAIASEFTGYDEVSKPTARSSRVLQGRQARRRRSRPATKARDHSRSHVVLRRARRPDRRPRHDRRRAGDARLRRARHAVHGRGDRAPRHAASAARSRSATRVHAQRRPSWRREIRRHHTSAHLLAARAQRRARRGGQPGRLVGRHRPHAFRLPLAAAAR